MYDFYKLFFFIFSGMTLAVVAILGHFSKTLLLFFIPQILNFIYSVPQLFKLIPCPRHRLPKYNQETDLRELSVVEFKERDLKLLGRVALTLLSLVRFIQIKNYVKDGENYIECNNLTLLNFVLKVFGPLHERTLTICILSFQIFCSCLAFGFRYYLAELLYGEVIA